jgi:hypothetical protein
MGRDGGDGGTGLHEYVETDVRSGLPLDRASSSARRSWASGTGARTSSSCSACSPRVTWTGRAAGTIFAGYLKLLPLFLFVLPGVIAHASGAAGSAHARPAGPGAARAGRHAAAGGAARAGGRRTAGGADELALVGLQLRLDPDHLGRLQEAAARRAGAAAGAVGQISTAVLVLFGLLWIPLMELISGQLYQYLQSVQAYIAPPIAAVFLLGILWPRSTPPARWRALLTGFVLGMTRLLMELNKGRLDGMALLLCGHQLPPLRRPALRGLFTRADPLRSGWRV